MEFLNWMLKTKTDKVSPKPIIKTDIIIKKHESPKPIITDIIIKKHDFPVYEYVTFGSEGDKMNKRYMSKREVMKHRYMTKAIPGKYNHAEIYLDANNLVPGYIHLVYLSKLNARKIIEYILNMYNNIKNENYWDRSDWCKQEASCNIYFVSSDSENNS